MVELSVVIPTYNRLPRLKQVLVALECQRYPLDAFEVVVISDGSQDGTHEYLAGYSGPLQLRFVPQANQGPAAARNRGIAEARGGLVLFIDDDVVPSAELVAEHMELQAGQAKRVVLGPMLSPQDFQLSAWVAWEQAMLEKQYAAMASGSWSPSARQFYTGNTSLPRELLLAVGGFDVRFRRAEDVELAWRLAQMGVEFVFHGPAVGWHYAERSYDSWLNTPYTYGRNEVVFSRERESWILWVVRQEFRERNHLIRSIVRLGLDRPLVSGLILSLCRQVAELSYRLGQRRLSQMAFSAVFNLRYYQGVADELGGRAEFLDRPHPPQPPSTLAHEQ